jgi:hypothetical protein
MTIANPELVVRIGPDDNSETYRIEKSDGTVCDSGDLPINSDEVRECYETHLADNGQGTVEAYVNSQKATILSHIEKRGTPDDQLSDDVEIEYVDHR